MDKERWKEKSYLCAPSEDVDADPGQWSTLKLGEDTDGCS